MFTKQGDSRDKVNIKLITLYSLLTAICLIVGYLENVLSIGLISIAPGVKVGLSNAVALTLIYSGNKKAAWAVNITRICLSALLFGSPISFVLSICGGLASTTLATVLCSVKSVSVIGTSIASGVTHNLFQLLAASVITGWGVVYYSPILVVMGAVCGAVCGVLAKTLGDKIKKLEI